MQVSETGMLERGDRDWRYRRCGGAGGGVRSPPPRAGAAPVLGGAGLGTSCVHRGCVCVCRGYPPAPGCGTGSRGGARRDSGAAGASRRRACGPGSRCPLTPLVLPPPPALLRPGVFPLLISPPAPLRLYPAVPRSPCPAPAGRTACSCRAGLGARPPRGSLARPRAGARWC